MSHINTLKSRLGEMFLRDRGNIDENTARLVKSEVRRTLEKFFSISDFSVMFSPTDCGETQISVNMKGIRLASFRER